MAHNLPFLLPENICSVPPLSRSFFVYMVFRSQIFALGIFIYMGFHSQIFGFASTLYTFLHFYYSCTIHFSHFLKVLSGSTCISLVFPLFLVLFFCIMGFHFQILPFLCACCTIRKNVFPAFFDTRLCMLNKFIRPLGLHTPDISSPAALPSALLTTDSYSLLPIALYPPSYNSSLP